MAKIIKVKDDVIIIGTDNNGMKEVRKEDLNFEGKVGDEVEIFESGDDEVIVTKKETSKNDISAAGININLSNTQNPQPMYIDNNTKAVNKVAYCVLALFLGGIGIHKFYAGKTSSGILYLLFCWTAIPAIISLIEFIVALCKTPDSNGNILV